MTTATKTKIPTAAVIENVAALDYHMLRRDFAELFAWLDAARVGDFELPPGALDFAGKLIHLAKQRAILVQPAAAPDGAKLLLAGESLADALRAAEKAADELHQYQGRPSRFWTRPTGISETTPMCL